MARALGRLRVASLLAVAVLAAAIGIGSAHAAAFGSGFKTRSVPVDGATLAVTTGGNGPPVVLIHGYAESSRMWKPLARELAPRYTKETIAALIDFLN